MNTISNVLFWISNGLLVPVAVLLILFLIQALILAGGFFGEYFRRRTVEKKVSSLLDGGATELEKAMASLPQDGKSSLLRAVRQLFAHRGDKAWCERLLANFEVEAEKELGRSRTLAKIGPMLGLMGTLIPMGPALVGLAAGDLASMAYNMQVAFATTVVGLLVAAIGVATLQVRQRWYAREANDLEYLVETLSHETE